MPVLYVLEPGAVVGRKRARLQVRKGGVVLAAPRIEDTEQLALAEAVHLSPRAAQALVAQGTEVLFMATAGTLLGRIGGAGARRFEARQRQRRASADPAFSTDLVRRLLAGQLAHQRELMQTLPNEGRTETSARLLVEMRLVQESLAQDAPAQALLAVAARAEALQMRALCVHLRAELAGLSADEARAPHTHLGALLRIGDALLGDLVHARLEGVGLDPLHPLLVEGCATPLSLVEAMTREARAAVVDRTVLMLLGRRSIRLADFRPAADSERPAEDAWAGAAGPWPALGLEAEAMKRFIFAYERTLQEQVWYAPQMRSLTRRQILVEQVHRVARHFRGESAYWTDAPALWMGLPAWAPPPPTEATPITTEASAAATPTAAPVDPGDSPRRLHVSEQGAIVLRVHDRIEARRGGEVIGSARLGALETLVLTGQVHLNAHARTALLRAGADVVMLGRSGAFIGRYSARDGARRREWSRQLERAEEPAYLLDLARRVVAGKIRNQRMLLQRREPRSPGLAKALVSMRWCLERLDTAPDLDAVRGLEGAAAAAYFGVFGELIRAEGIEFPGRIRRPPPDPTNILLSFGYTLLTRLMHGALEVANLDPYAGALHAPVDNRVSLALDLIEEFRPIVVDTLVIALLNRRIIRATDFTPMNDEAVPVEDAWEREASEASADAPPPRRKLILSREAGRRFLLAYDRRLSDEVWYAPLQRRVPYRTVIQEQVERLRRHVWGLAPYEPFLMSA